MAYDEKLAERVRAALANRDDVVEKRMFGGIAFMVRGHMSCGVVASTLMVRLAPADADRLMNAPHVRPMDFTGAPDARVSLCRSAWHQDGCNAATMGGARHSVR